MTAARPRARRPAAIVAIAATLATASLVQAAEPPPLRVALNKAEVIPLTGAASVVLVASPHIADVVLEKGRILFVLGKRTGETRLYVYSDGGKRLFERDIVVVPTQERTVTVTRGTRAVDYGCDSRCAALGFAAGVEASPGDETLAPAAAPAPQAPAPAAAPAAATSSR